MTSTIYRLLHLQSAPVQGVPAAPYNNLLDACRLIMRSRPTMTIYLLVAGAFICALNLALNLKFAISLPLIWIICTITVGEFIPTASPRLALRRLLFPLSTANSNRLDILDVFRTFAIVWVMANHLGSEGRVDILERRPSAAAFKEAVHSNSIFGPLFGNSSLGVEIFLVLSGLLAARSWNRHADMTFSSHYAKFIVRRVIRILPPVAIFVLFAFTTVTSYLPRFATTMIGACKPTSVLSVLTFTNNYAETPTCLGYLWYLGLDMQLYVMAPLLLYVLRRRPRLGFVAAIFIISISTFLRAFHCYFYGVCNQSDVDIPFISRPDDDATTLADVYAGLWDMYARPPTKCGPFIIGLLVGHFLDSIRKRLNSYPKNALLRVHRFTFVVATTVALVAVYGILPQYWWTGMGSAHLYNIFYTALFRNVFAAAIAFLILLYYNKCGLKILPIWSTLARLSFTAYLVHMPVMYVFNDYAPYQEATGVAGLLATLPLALALSFTAAALFHSFVEVPLAALLFF